MELVAAAAKQPAVEAHQEGDLGLGTLPVLAREREHRQPPHAELVRADDRVPHRLLAGRVAVGPGQPAELGPPAVAVHHDADVVRQAIAVEIVEVGAHVVRLLARIGRLFMRRSRWYSVKPNSSDRDSRLHPGIGLDVARLKQPRTAERRQEVERLERRRAGVEVGVRVADRAAEAAREAFGRGGAADRAGRERGVEPRQGQELEQERLGDGGGVGRLGVERPHPGQQEHEQADVPLVLLGDLVDGLQHGLPRGEQTEVAPERTERARRSRPG